MVQGHCLPIIIGTIGRTNKGGGTTLNHGNI